MKQAQLLITMDDAGNVNVSGPIENKLLCFGMIEMAKPAIQNYVPSPIIKPINGGLNNMAKA
jgi:hypothetical protein